MSKTYLIISLFLFVFNNVFCADALKKELFYSIKTPETPKTFNGWVELETLIEIIRYNSIIIKEEHIFTLWEKQGQKSFSFYPAENLEICTHWKTQEVRVGPDIYFQNGYAQHVIKVQQSSDFLINIFEKMKEYPELSESFILMKICQNTINRIKTYKKDILKITTNPYLSPLYKEKMLLDLITEQESIAESSFYKEDLPNPFIAKALYEMYKQSRLCEQKI